MTTTLLDYFELSYVFLQNHATCHFNVSHSLVSDFINNTVQLAIIICLRKSSPGNLQQFANLLICAKFSDLTVLLMKSCVKFITYNRGLLFLKKSFQNFKTNQIIAHSSKREKIIKKKVLFSYTF